MNIHRCEYKLAILQGLGLGDKSREEAAVGDKSREEAAVGDQVQGDEPDVGDQAQGGEPDAGGNFQCQWPCKFKTRDAFNLQRHQAPGTRGCIRSF